MHNTHISPQALVGPVFFLTVRPRSQALVYLGPFDGHVNAALRKRWLFVFVTAKTESSFRKRWHHSFGPLLAEKIFNMVDNHDWMLASLPGMLRIISSLIAFRRDFCSRSLLKEPPLVHIKASALSYLPFRLTSFDDLFYVILKIFSTLSSAV